MASVVATAAATRLLPKFSAPWLGRGHVALPPSPGRPLAVTVAAASPRPGEGGRRGKKRRRARGADQEDGLSLSSGEPRPRLEMETTNSTPRTRADKGAKPAPEASMTRKGSAIRRVTLVVLAAVFFGVSIALRDGVGMASEYFAGYLLEQSLSVDNLFVFVLVFKYFKVPQEYQSRVLSYGIAGAVILRAVMIILGAATIQRFEAVNLLLALILLFSSYKLFAEDDEESDLSDNFIVKACQKDTMPDVARAVHVPSRVRRGNSWSRKKRPTTLIALFYFGRREKGSKPEASISNKKAIGTRSMPGKRKKQYETRGSVGRLQQKSNR